MTGMSVGMVGLGRMGQGLTDRLRKMGHQVVGYDQNPAVSDASSLAQMVERLPSPRVVWLMVPAGDVTESALHDV
ncbi:MAG: NAD(P)-binding domain-containing protein, partial [Dehalococcoidia bacterium]